MYTSSTLSELWAVDVATIEDLCQRGRLHGRLVHGKWEISAAAIARFLHTRPRMGPHRSPRVQTTQTLRLT